MILIEAFIRHEALDGIRAACAELGLPSMSVSEAKGSGRQPPITETYRGATTRTFMRPTLRLEMVVADEEVDRVIDVILSHAHTGDPGDGKIFLIPVADAIRIRTGERGDAVIAAHT